MKKQIVFLLTLMSVVLVFAQNDPQAFTRKILLEQFTTALCGYCPAGAERLRSATDGNNNVVWLRYHAGYGTDDLTNDIAQTMTRFYGGSTFAPAMMVDRTHFDSSRPGPVTSVGQVSDIHLLLDQAKSVKTYCKVQTPKVKFNADTRSLECTVTGRFSDEVYSSSTRLQILLVEDSIYMSQSDYGVGQWVNYWHLGVVRDTLTPMWGMELEVSSDANRNFSHTVTYTLPSAFKYKNCKVVAIVYNYAPNDINNCQVLNAAISDYISQTLGIGEVADGTGMRLFPNPATDRIVVEAETPMLQVTVVDAMGRCPITLAADGSRHVNIDLSSLAAGVYIVQAKTSSGIATRQLILR